VVKIESAKKVKVEDVTVGVRALAEEDQEINHGLVKPGFQHQDTIHLFGINLKKG
jgi:hypothetical protein